MTPTEKLAMTKRWERDMAKLTPASGEPDIYCFVRESLSKAQSDLHDTDEEER